MQQPILGGDAERRLLSQTAAWAGSLFGIPGFFRPRLPPPFAAWQGSKGALSYYDTAPLRASLEKLVDFDRLRSEEHTSELQSLMRISYAVFCLKKKQDGPKQLMR